MPDYLVITNVAPDVTSERIVRAKNRATALAHVVADTITIRQAFTDDAIRLARAGGGVEEAKEVA